MGILGAESWDLFTAGATELVTRTKPTQLLCYGPMPISLGVEVREYPTFWQQRRKTQDGR